MNGLSLTRWALATLVACASGAVHAEESGPSDPFVQAAAAARATGGESERDGASAGNPFRLRGEDQPAAAEGLSRRETSDRALAAARRALSVGDLARAQQFLAKAEQLDVAYDGPGDSPARVAESIRQGQELRKSTNGGTHWRQAYSKFLVQQAEALLSWNDLDNASRVALEASQLNPN